MISPQQNIEGHVVAADANASADSGAPVLILAGGTGDGVKITGVSIDCIGVKSIALVTSYLAALTDTKTLALAHELQESADNSSWDSAEVIEASTVKGTGTTGGTNERGVCEFAINMHARKRYIRFNVTPELSASATDTATFHTIAVKGGHDVLPAA